MAGGRRSEGQHCGGLRICGNPTGDVSHASNFGSALVCALPRFQCSAGGILAAVWERDHEPLRSHPA
jgi:hypothetical protein